MIVIILRPAMLPDELIEIRPRSSAKYTKKVMNL